MRIGEVFRNSKSFSSAVATIDGLPNFIHCTATTGEMKALLEAGINSIKAIKAVDGARTPAILISNSPHKAGSLQAPWQDLFDPDNGRVRYFGDCKDPGKDPTSTTGNQALLDQFRFHQSAARSGRLQACPIVFFERVRIGSRVKGNVRFQGFGVISKAELVSQLSRSAPYSFRFICMSLRSSA